MKKINKNSSKKNLKKVNSVSKKGLKKNFDKLKNVNPHNVFIKTGVKGFDDLFNNEYGLPSGASILIEGGPGSGKTIFSLAVINGLCSQGKKCLYMSFEEPEERLLNHMKNFEWPADEYVKKGLLKVERFSALDISRSVEALLSAAKKELLIKVDPVLFPEDFKPDFIVIDSLSAIASAFSGHESRFRIYMEQLFRYLEEHKITNFLIREVATPTHVGNVYKEKGEAVSFLSDGIVVLYNVIYKSGKRDIAMEILKMRGVSFRKEIVKMEIINKKGVIIHSDRILKSDKNNEFELT
ncbi:hypothetical protein M0R72_16065 [Candidatus Pacearchaeota archaeon]|jgi:circadian clock protein KaiC|nr:hypothetical protein [Candidatus Pacearchaeota archaeon]